MTMTHPDTDLACLTAREMLDGYAARKFTPVEVLDAVQRRVERLDAELNAFVLREDERARDRAAESSARWAGDGPTHELDGIPITLKENIAIIGAPLTSGTAAMRDAAPQTEDGPVALTTDGAGAVRLGTTTMPDYGMLSSGVSSLHGITRSPWNLVWTVGGSSGGAAAAAAAGGGPGGNGRDNRGGGRPPPR